MTFASSRAPAGDDADEVYRRIHLAVVEHRLRPGTKLPEERLAALFGVGRSHVRKALAQLAHEQVVEVFPKRGAFVARPTVDQARDVFEARTVIEPAIMRRLTRKVDDAGVARLRAHVAAELDAAARDDRRAVVRLSGEFHDLAADLAGNSAFARSIRELTALTCLVILLYDTPTSAACRADDHAAIVDALVAGDAELAVSRMEEHLTEIERTVRLSGDGDDDDLGEVFGL